MNKHKLTNKQLKYFAKMASESYANDPVHSYVTKSEALRKRFVYHFMIERLATSSSNVIVFKSLSGRSLFAFATESSTYFLTAL